MFNRSFLANLISKPIGVTTKKNIIPIIIGDIIFPKKIPNINQTLLKGDKIFEFIKPKYKKIIEITKDQTLISSLERIGYTPITRKTIKNTIPKLLFELIFMFSDISEIFSIFFL